MSDVIGQRSLGMSRDGVELVLCPSGGRPSSQGVGAIGGARRLRIPLTHLSTSAIFGNSQVRKLARQPWYPSATSGGLSLTGSCSLLLLTGPARWVRGGRHDHDL